MDGLSNFVLEALKNELALLVFILSDSVFSFEFVELHSLRVLEFTVLRMEHMGAKIKHCSFVDLGAFVFYMRVKFTGGVNLGVVLNKLTDALNEIAIFDDCLELVFGKIRKADKEMH